MNELIYRAVGQAMSTLLFPVIPWVLQVAVIGYFLAVAVYLASANDAAFKVVGSNQSLANCNCSGFVLVSLLPASFSFFFFYSFSFRFTSFVWCLPHRTMVSATRWGSTSGASAAVRM